MASNETLNDTPRVRLAVLINLIPPYRVRILELLGRRFRTGVFLSGSEDNRTGWDKVPDPDLVDLKRSWGLTFKRKVSNEQGAIDVRYLHITPGYLLDLIRFRPHAVLTAEMGGRTLAGLVYGLLTRTPVWVWFEGTIHTERGRGRLRTMIRRVVIRLAYGFVSSGMTTTEYLRSIGVPAGKIVEAQLNVDEREFTDPSVEARWDLHPKPVLLFVGRLVKLKGADLFFEAAARMQQAGREFAMLMVGDGPEQAALEAQIARLGLRNVTFAGNLLPAEMPPAYRSADCLVFPTLGDVWGLVVSEALWSGIPVVASRFAGCAPELLPRDNLFDPTDPDDFDRVLAGFLEGKLAPPDPSALRTSREVADTIADTILDGLARRRR